MKQPKLSYVMLLISEGKKHIIIMQLRRADSHSPDHRGRFQCCRNHCCTAYTIQQNLVGRGGRQGVGKPLSHPQLRTWLVGALNFLCMNYDIRNSWLVSHQNEAPISAQGLEIQMRLSSYPLCKVAHLDVTSRLAGQRC